MTQDAPPPIDRNDALFLDFDGTIAPIEDHPNDVRLPEGVADAVLRAADYLQGAAAIISGRDIRDLDRRTPRQVMRIGAHGLEVAAPGAAPDAAPAESPPAIAAALDAIARERPQVWIERKGPVMAVHYRGAPGLEDELRARVVAALEPFPDYLAQFGKMVIEAKPAAANKGAALAAAMARPPFKGRRPVMAGDDATDEDAFAKVHELGGVSVKVGAGKTCARYRLEDHAAVADWLARSVVHS